MQDDIALHFFEEGIHTLDMDWVNEHIKNRDIYLLIGKTIIKLPKENK